MLALADEVIEPATSPLGQTRKSALVTAMSAFPPIATKLRTSREVRFVPNSAVTGYHFAFSTHYAAEQREAQLLPNITQRGCA
jgi:hypothetical protein